MVMLIFRDVPPRRDIVDRRPEGKPMFSASQSLRGERSPASIRANLLAGLTVGIIAFTAVDGLAIASGVPPQHGLYTAIVAGVVIALAGGSAVNISGPTAAFVVVLLPIVNEHGIGGLLIAGFMAGVILVLMGLARLGRLIEIVPYPVIIIGSQPGSRSSSRHCRSRTFWVWPSLLSTAISPTR